MYDIAGRKRIERSAVGTEVQQDSATYTYYDDDTVRTITDPRGNVLTHAYDGFGRLSVLSYPDEQSESYAYDANDNRTGFTQRDGTLSTTTYDALNRPEKVKRPGLPDTSYGLDIMGRVVAEKAGTVLVRTHGYDSAGRKVSANVTLPRPATGVTGSAPTVAMGFTYDDDGNRTGATWSGATVGWHYDGLGRVTGIDLGAEAVTRHAYDLLGRRTGTTRTDIAHGDAKSSYEYDIAGQLKELRHSWSGGSLKASYRYDDAGALVSEALDNSAFRWEPAPTLSKTVSYAPASPINALTSVDGVAQVHDARGNRTGAATRTWRYDSRNMLVGANAPGMAVTYGYYPEGGRAWKQVNNVTTLYLELDGIEWGTYDASGTLKERTIRASGNGGAVAAVHSHTGGLIRLLPNRQGSVIGWLRPDGKLGGAYTYDAYGNSPQAGAAGPAFRYAGMRNDAETGLYHTPFRAYDPVDGRWMQLDPIGIEDGLNRYAYVRNNPVNFIDPSGKRVAVTWHHVLFGNNHAAIRITPIDQETYVSDPRFANIDENGNSYSVLSAGPQYNVPGIWGNLISNINRDTDVGPQTGSVDVPMPGMFENENSWINALFSADNNYQDNVNYEAFPGQDDDNHNSNSYAAGLLRATGATPPAVESVPGYEKPVGIEHFRVGDIRGTLDPNSGILRAQQTRATTRTRIPRSINTCVDTSKCSK
ncbi:RHS repeat-associated core domain-containing protein [Niveispirillum sp. KHB5.9]|uniref:RHS repeat-associated core domain-containing protein n=1 Tax=Niveispirillum sp. KHB5.9 TaxID=3400269 RepID=UPI003A8AA7BC